MQYIIVDGEGIIPSGTTEIEEDAFTERKELTSIDIPASVTQIDVNAFDGCTNLTSIKVSPHNKVYDSREDCNAIIETATNTLVLGCATTKIPEGVTTIGWGAFDGCKKLKNIEIPASVRIIEEGAFRYSGIEQLELPPSLDVIGESAFEGCSKLKNLVIPASVKVIEESAFYECSKLASVEILSSDVEIRDGAFEECNALKTVKMPYSDEYHGCFCYCPNLTNVEMPLVEVIGDSAFKGQEKLKKLMFPKLLEVGEEAFKGCTGLKSISMPRVEEIKTSAFEDCTQLKDIEMSEVQVVEESAFAGCTALESVEMPSLEGIGDEAFYGCTALRSVKVSSNKVSSDEEELFGGMMTPFAGCDNLTSFELLTAEHGNELNYYGILAPCELSNLKEIIVPSGTGKYYRKKAQDSLKENLIVEQKPEKSRNKRNEEEEPLTWA